MSNENIIDKQQKQTGLPDDGSRHLLLLKVIIEVNVYFIVNVMLFWDAKKKWEPLIGSVSNFTSCKV